MRLYFLVFSLLIMSCTVLLQAEEDLYPRLRPANTADLPKNFRACDALRISGSGQFSGESLKHLLTKLPKENVTIVDLRGEFHGFVNGLDVSWKKRTSPKPSYSYYLGWKSGTLETLEKDRLQSLITGKKEAYQTDLDSVEILATTVQSERELVESLGAHYLRLPIADARKPSDEEMDRFLSFYHSLPKNSWLHFHCAGGEGRTTTLMALIDIISNSDLPLESIIQRQRVIGGINLDVPKENSGEHSEKMLWVIERLGFLKMFHQYCREKSKETWSTWVLWKNVSQ